MNNINYKIEYHEGYYSVGNNIPFDNNKSEAWKEGYIDGEYSIYGESEHDKEMKDE